MTANSKGWFRGKPPLIQRIQADRTAMRALAHKKRSPTPWTVVSNGDQSLMAAYEYLEDAEQAVRCLTNRGVPCNIVGPYREGAPTSKEDDYFPATVEWHTSMRALTRDERYAFPSFEEAFGYAERQTRRVIIQEWHDGILVSQECVLRSNGNMGKVVFPVRDTNQTAEQQKHVTVSAVKHREGTGMWDEEIDDGSYSGGTGVATKSLTPPRTPRPSSRSVWNDACRRFAASSEKLTAYETDIEAVYFTKPLLRDVTEKATAAFYDAFGEAQLLLHDSFDADRDDAEELFRAVTKAERAWDAANANAQRKAAQNIIIGGRALSEDQVRELNTAKRALARVLDPASSPAEAAKAWNLVQGTVDALRLRPSESLDAKLVFALPSALRELPA